MNKPHPATLLLVIPFVIAMLPAIAQPAQGTGVTRLTRNRAVAQNFKPVEWLVGRAVDTSTPDSTRGSRIDILIERWSTDAEYDTLRSAFSEGGPDNALAAIRKGRRRVGVVQFAGRQGLGARARARRGQNLLFARELNTPTGRRVIIATDGYPDFDQHTSESRVPEHGFALIDIRLASDGTGVGKMARAAQITYDKETAILELSDYETEPIRLTELRSEKP